MGEFDAVSNNRPALIKSTTQTTVKKPVFDYFNNLLFQFSDL
jgi:hypothetical protein